MKWNCWLLVLVAIGVLTNLGETNYTPFMQYRFVMQRELYILNVFMGNL